MNWDPDSKLTMFTSSFAESNVGVRKTGIPEAEVRRRLVDYLADEITDKCLTRKVGTYCTEYQLRMYVLTHDQLEKLIQARASRMHPSMPSVYEVEKSAPS